MAHIKVRNVNAAFTELVTMFRHGAKFGSVFGTEFVKRPSRNGQVVMADEVMTITYEKSCRRCWRRGLTRRSRR